MSPCDWPVACVSSVRIGHPAHRSPERRAQRGHQDFLRVDLALGAEAAAHVVREYVY